MRQDKIKAINLRKAGKSYRDIEAALNIPKSTLTGWFQKTEWSRKIKKELSLVARQKSSRRMKALLGRIKETRQKEYALSRKNAHQEFAKLKKELIFIAGLMIYWGEGDKNLVNGRIRVSNTDPVMIKLFNIFIQKYLREIFYKTKAYLVLYPDLNEEECKKFWSANTGISVEKFIKSTFISGQHPTKRLGHGICTIIITSRVFKEKINTWLNLIRNEVIKMRA